MQITNLTFKEKRDKVIAALEINRVMAKDADGNYTKEVTPKVITEAISIMRGMDDGEPVPTVKESLTVHKSAEDYLRHRYGAYRGHFAWRELEEAYSQGRYDEEQAQGPSPWPDDDPEVHYKRGYAVALSDSEEAIDDECRERVVTASDCIEIIRNLGVEPEPTGCTSNCVTCHYSGSWTGIGEGHCYMFKDEPQGVCAKWTVTSPQAAPSNPDKYELKCKDVIDYPRQAAPSQTGWTGDPDIDAALIMLDRMDVSPDDDARLDEIASLLRRMAGRAGRKG